MKYLYNKYLKRMRAFYLFNNRILSHIAFWLAILFMYTFFPFIYKGNFWEILKNNLFFLPQDIIAVYFVLYVLFPKYLVPLKLFRFILFTLITIIFLTSISIFVTNYILPKLYYTEAAESIPEQFSNSLFILLSITGMAATIKYVRLNIINQFQKAEISMKQMESELKYLRSQINPHFLFNSLNNIDELIYEDQEKASKAIFYLSEILRYVLKESELKTVEAPQEIEFIENYINFIRFSFKNKDFIQCSIEGVYSNRQIPPLLFIPIIENAVKYVDRKAKPTGIDIKFTFNKNQFQLECTNHVSEFINTNNKNGIGLKNLKRRLELSYPDNHLLDISQNGNLFRVQLKIWE